MAGDADEGESSNLVWSAEGGASIGELRQQIPSCQLDPAFDKHGREDRGEATICSDIQGTTLCEGKCERCPLVGGLAGEGRLH